MEKIDFGEKKVEVLDKVLVFPGLFGFKGQWLIKGFIGIELK